MENLIAVVIALCIGMAISFVWITVLTVNNYKLKDQASRIFTVIHDLHVKSLMSDESLFNIRSRIAELESPPKFKVDDIVWIESNSCGSGVQYFIINKVMPISNCIRRYECTPLGFRTALPYSFSEVELHLKDFSEKESLKKNPVGRPKKK